MKSTRISNAQPTPHSFREHLTSELAKRCAGNSQYSLRAFARDLGTDHSTLSQQLRGRRRLTETAIRQYAAALGTPEDRLVGYLAFAAEHPASTAPDESLRRARDLTEDALEVLGSLDHFAILELTHLDSFRPDVNWIARVLGLENDAVNIALQRLVRLGMLVMTAHDRWEDRSGDATTVFERAAYRTVASLSQRVRQRAFEDLADSPAPLEYSATTVSIDRARLPEALARIARFRRELLEWLGEGAAREDLYHLEISFLPLTTTPENS